jgi:lipoprotein-anchoring transpeptidase ErfK/SrfK
MTMHRALFALTLVIVALAASTPAGAQTPPVIAAGVTAAGIDVSGMTEEQATDELQAFFDRRIIVHFGARAISVRPAALRARGRVFLAVRDALAAAPGTAIPLQVIVNERAIRIWVNQRAKVFRRAPVSTRAVLVRLTPHLTAPKPGRELMTYYARLKMVAALRKHDRDVTMPWRALKPTRTPSNHGPVVVIQRGSKRLVLYRGTRAGAMNAVASFGVATGMARYPTPTGNFRIATRQRNPWWYPPAADWARGASPVPPGPGNPLGTRWMGLNVGAVGIHGTPDAASIGYSASHGCIRMRISDAEWLFERVRVGTPVFIRSA